jgi:hypothetical protein
MAVIEAPEMLHTATNGDAIEYGFATVLLDETPQIVFRYADDQDRLLVLDNPHARDAPFKIDTDQTVDRLAGVSRDLQDVLGQVSVTKQLVALVSSCGGRVAGEGTEAGCVREKLAHLRV